MEKDVYERAVEIFKDHIGEEGFTPIVENIPDSTATDVAGIVSDFNDLLAALKAAGIMAADEVADEEEEEDPEDDDNSGDPEVGA